MAKQMQDDLIPIGNFNLGGLAYSKWSGVENSLYKFTGWDPHSTPGLLKVAQKMTKETTGAPPSEFCKARVNSSNGAQYWGSSTSGKIWERPSSGTWRLVHTVTPAAGEAKILEMKEYQGYIYIATESRLHRILVSEADDNTWNADLVEDWATFGVTDKELHPMFSHIQTLILYIGDGNQLAQVDGNTFSANALDIKTPLRIKSLGEIGTDILLGTYVADTVTKTEIIRWNTWSVSFATSDSIPEVGINAFLPADNFVIVQAGNQGNLYYYDGEKLKLYDTKIPGDYSPTKYGEVYPTAVGSLGGQILFGFSNGSGNPADQGVYRIARSTSNHPYILDMPYPTSVRSASALVLSNTEIGGILVVGTDIYVSFKNGANIGVDKLDYSAKLELAYFETRVMIIEREQFSTFSKFVAAYADLPANTAITIQYEKNYAASFANTSEKVDTARKIVLAEEGVEATTLRLKILPTVSSNDAPQIESAGVFLS